MKSILEFIVKNKFKNQSEKYLCVGYNNHFHMLNAHFCDFWHLVSNIYGNSPFILSIDEIKNYKKYIDEVYEIPAKYELKDKCKQDIYDIQNDWADSKLKLQDLKKINIDDII